MDHISVIISPAVGGLSKTVLDISIWKGGRFKVIYGGLFEGYESLKVIETMQNIRRQINIEKTYVFIENITFGFSRQLLQLILSLNDHRLFVVQHKLIPTVHFNISSL
jgi:hypothetical protein